MTLRETRSTCPYCGVGCGVIIEHEPRLLTLYAPLSAIAVAAGDRLGGGTRLGLSVGDEVYLQLQVDGLPLDPVPWLSTLKGAAAAPTDKPHTEKEKEKEKPRPRRRRERP